MPKVVTAGARPGRLRAGPPDEREGVAMRSREILRVETNSGASDQRVAPSERLASPDAGAARELGSPQNSVAVSPEPVDLDSVRRRNAFQAGSRELARFLRQNGEAFARAQEAAEGDASGFAQAWMEDFDHRAGEVFNRIPSEVRALFGNDFEALRAESFAEADSFERDRRILAIQQGIGGTRDDYVKLVGQEPARLDYAFQKMEEVIRASGLRPDLIEEEVLATRRAIFTSYRQARLAGPNPEALLREMEAGRFDADLTFEEKSEFLLQADEELDQVRREGIEQAERQNVLADRERKAAQRQTYEDLVGQIFDGGDPLTERQINGLKREQRITPRQADKLNAMRRAEAAGGSDPVLLFDLLQQEANGALTLDTLLGVFQSQALSFADASGFLNRLRQGDGGPLARSDARIGRRRVHAGLGAVPDGVSQLRDLRLQRAIEADQAYLRLVTEDGMDPSEAERRVVSIYREQPSDLPTPLNGRRPKSIEDIPRLAAEVLRAHRQGVIDDATLHRERELLDRWVDSFGRP